MPHAGLMNEKELGPEAGPLQRARLHLRGGRRRLRQGKTAAGIATLADALSAAFEWYFASHGPTLGAAPTGNEQITYGILVRAGVLDGKFDMEFFAGLTDAALQRELPGYEYGPVLAGVESVMTQLGVMPFDEASLPPEDPSTF